MKQILLYAFILLGNLTYCQDWCGWAFEYDFKIANEYSNKLDSLEVLLNEPYKGSQYRKGNLKYNDSTKIYTVQLEYGCVSCGFDGMNNPPTIFLKAKVYDDLYHRKHSIIIPIFFETQEKYKFRPFNEAENKKYFSEYNPVYYDLGEIKYSKFTDGRHRGIRIDEKGKRYDFVNKEFNFPYPEMIIAIK